jgi:formamidopyrimidine-DNA glycosylase
MPELPDVEAFKQYLDATSLHKSIGRSTVHDERILSGLSPQRLGRGLKGAEFQESSRHGKYLFVKTSKGPWLLLHFGMTGELQYSESDGDMPDHTRVSFHFKDGGRLDYVCQRLLGRVDLVDQVDSFVEDQQLGPDALDAAITPEWLYDQFSTRPAPIKSALMDQSLLAGIGNVYSDEILFQAGLRPETPANRLSKQDVAHLRRTMRRVLRTTARHQADVAEFPRSYLTRQREKGGQCPKCKGKLERHKVSGRTSYFCPKCQKKR